MRRTGLSEAEVTRQVRALEGLGVEALRAQWRARYGAPPRLRSADHLARLLAWRMQAQALGGLDTETRQALARKSSRPRGPGLQPGCKVVREWRGVRHEVEVTEAGLRYAGRPFDSLSQVAREITGVRWNGPRFFGLRQPKSLAA